MKKDWSVLLVSVTFILFGVISILWLSELGLILFWTGVLLVATGFIVLGKFLTPKTRVHSWEKLKEKNYFWILAVGEDFKNQNKTVGTVVLKIYGFGKTIMDLPAEESFWPNGLPEVGKKYFKDGKKFHQILDN